MLPLCCISLPYPASVRTSRDPHTPLNSSEMTAADTNQIPDRPGVNNPRLRNRSPSRSLIISSLAHLLTFKVTHLADGPLRPRRRLRGPGRSGGSG